MAFAVEHAIAHNLQRVIVVIPYTSITEQNAAVYRNAFGAECVLEHHSAFDPKPDKETPASRLAPENWDFPIVVTTNVQLFESLFACRTSRCRKLHRLARSVVVLDEAQTLPVGLLEPTLDSLGFLTRRAGASVVICTATQPSLGKDTVHTGLENVREISPCVSQSFEELRRVTVKWPGDWSTPQTWEGLADEISQAGSALAITHLRRDARALFEAVRERCANVSHLSALMCPEHRFKILAEVKSALRAGAEVRLISTQLVEAGVDIDFPVVFRAVAGFDAMAQAAGRCNREGRLDAPGELRVFVPESSPPPGILRTGRDVALCLLRADPGLDLLSPESQKQYFE
ncbi:MAG: CRISPR-associated endonuclease Cas3'', partial [Myxococcota bacterium]